ncbi:hypothetical protein [Enterovibrio norvegicus]|uniref:Uncharacterized protein n=1 Tax=Enterovibrio norvegicus TaxID=188144 RepID=A0ABV4L5E6_9GAMM
MIYIPFLAILVSIYLYKNIISGRSSDFDEYHFTAVNELHSVSVDNSQLATFEESQSIDDQVHFNTSSGVLSVDGEEIRKFNSCSRNYKIMKYLSFNKNIWVEFSELEKNINVDVNKKNLHDMKLPPTILELSKDSVRLIS